MREIIFGNLNEILIYLLIINFAGFLSMGIDKFKAKKSMWRTPEKTLFLIAIFGGSIGSIIGMYIFRHKTKHSSFVYGFPIILTIQAVIIFMLLK